LIEKLRVKYSVKLLCFILEVSKSWYYKNRKVRSKEERENEDKMKIKEVSEKYKRKYGYRRIIMILKRDWVIMNHKKVLRLMKKYWFLSKIRKKNPYKQIWKATQEHRTVKNILNREFKWCFPYKKLWTDITYIKYKWKNIYLSIVKDMISWEILSNKIWNNLWLSIVFDSIELLKKHEIKWALIHSDQWFHYTHPSYQYKIKDLWMIQSMSRKWNCLDNAPTESFFWHMKDEIDISECKNLKEVQNYFNNYMFEYNNNRPQWHKKKMTPVEYRNHLISNKCVN